jgi:uncharacterized protein
MTPDCTVIVFAKAPVAGQVKTRLAKLLGEDGAARLAARMLDATLDHARTAGIGPVELCCAPDATHPQFRAAAESGIRLTLQGEGNLGDRMQRALAGALARTRHALLIGTDAPALGPAVLRAAAAALNAHPAVLVPAADGGYVLVGLARPCPELFEEIAWSTPQVMAQTRARLSRLGLQAAELPSMNDVDGPEDLVHVPQEWMQ